MGAVKQEKLKEHNNSVFAFERDMALFALEGLQRRVQDALRLVPTNSRLYVELSSAILRAEEDAPPIRQFETLDSAG